MQFRTFKFLGVGFSKTSEIVISVEFCGHVIHQGPCPALPVARAHTRDYANLAYELCEGTVPVNCTGALPLKITVQSGALFFGDVMANYTFGYRNMWDTPDQSYNTLSLGTDCKKNINIHDTTHAPGIHDCWYFRLLEQQTLQCDIYYPPGQAILLVPPGYASGVNLSSPDPLDL
jgi:hypothetical protein